MAVSNSDNSENTNNNDNSNNDNSNNNDSSDKNSMAVGVAMDTGCWINENESENENAQQGDSSRCNEDKEEVQEEEMGESDSNNREFSENITDMQQQQQAKFTKSTDEGMTEDQAEKGATEDKEHEKQQIEEEEEEKQEQEEIEDESVVALVIDLERAKKEKEFVLCGAVRKGMKGKASPKELSIARQRTNFILQVYEAFNHFVGMSWEDVVTAVEGFKGFGTGSTLTATKFRDIQVAYTALGDNQDSD